MGLVKVNVDQLKKRAERFGMNVSSVSQKVTMSNIFRHVSRFFLISGTIWISVRPEKYINHMVLYTPVFIKYLQMRRGFSYLVKNVIFEEI